MSEQIKITNRIIPTISAYAKEHLLYVQEIGTLTSRSPHISTRNNIHSFLFLIVISGSGRFTYRGNVSTLRSGDIVFVDCKEPYAHESSADDPWTLNWVHFYGAELDDIYARFIASDYSYIMHPSSLAPFLTTLDNLYSINNEQSATAEIMSHKYLTDLIAFAFTENMQEDRDDVTLLDKLKNIRSYLNSNYSSRITLDDLSQAFFVSKYHLAREYKRFYGTTLINDLNDIRISHAKSALRFSSDSIEDIAINCGFTDAGYFIKVFKASEGMTPLTYRKKW